MTIDQILKNCIISLEGCWLWQGFKNPKGYGRINFNGRQRFIHSITYENKYGKISSSKEHHHTCRNKSCCNPDHIEVLSKAYHRMLEGKLITECPKGHPYDAKNTQWSKGSRHCKTCRKAKILVKKNKLNS